MLVLWKITNGELLYFILLWCIMVYTELLFYSAVTSTLSATAVNAFLLPPPRLIGAVAKTAVNTFHRVIAKFP